VRKLRRLLLQFCLLGTMSMLLSGCFLRLLFGSVGQRDTDFGIAFIARIGGTFGPTAMCDIGETEELVECIYSFFDIEAEVPFTMTSTAELIADFGLFGAMVDPVVLQVPAAASKFSATIDDGSGPRSLVIAEAGSFLAQPGTEVRAEAGHRFVILDLPPDLLAALTQSGQLAGPFNFQLEFELPALAPVTVKGMYTGKVVVDGQTYYPPMLPCVTDFASVPALTIPVNDRPGLLLPTLLSRLRGNPDLVCRGQVYDFRPADDGTGERVYLPLARR
jgi:hypothetical protein